jgi:Kdo2-lipid IVA lauroyltransferase/acyltransferase
MLTQIGIGFLWLIHLLPLRVIGWIGAAAGVALFHLGRGRVTLINLKACFPEMSDAARRKLARCHFIAVSRSFLELGILSWSSKERIKAIVRLEDAEHLSGAGHRPVILLAPHFVGLEMGGSRIAVELRSATLYSRQKNAALEALVVRTRTRFGNVALFPRQEGLRGAIRAIRDKRAFYFLPDQDFGSRDSIFVPFFGVAAATAPILSRLSKLTGALVVPCVTRQLPGSAGYVMRFYPAWKDFPSADRAADTRRMNEFIEDRVREMPEQYLWIHKRFKTRPTGEADFYA